MDYVALDSDVLPVLRPLRLPDLNACYSLRDEVSALVGIALGAHDADRLRGELVKLVAVHRAGIGLALSNSLPTFGLSATAEEWPRRLSTTLHIGHTSDVEGVLIEFEEPSAWDVYLFPDSDLTEMLRQAFQICQRSGCDIAADLVYDRLNQQGLSRVANELQATPPPSRTWVAETAKLPRTA